MIKICIRYRNIIRNQLLSWITALIICSNFYPAFNTLIEYYDLVLTMDNWILISVVHILTYLSNSFALYWLLYVYTAKYWL